MRYHLFVVVAIGAVALCGISCGSGVSPLIVPGVEVAYTTPSGGVAFDSEVVPSEAIILTFNEAVGEIEAALTCDGAAQSITLEVISATQFEVVLPSSGLPQKSHCVLTITILGTSIVITQSFDVGCAASDDFSNAATLDTTADSYNYGSGCWLTNYVRFVPDDYVIADGMLAMDSAQPLFTGDGFTHYAMVGKRIAGAEYTVTIPLDFDYIFTDPAADGEVQLQLIVTNSYAPLFENRVAPLLIMGYGVRLDTGVTERTCWEGMATNVGVPVDPIPFICGDGSRVPYFAFTKSGTVFTPVFSFDGGATWTTYDAVDLGAAYADEVYVFILSYSAQVDAATALISEVSFTGDAVFVK